MPSKKIPYNTQSTKWSQEYTNLGLTGMNTDYADDNVEDTSWRLLKNVELSDFGSISPRRGFQANDSESVEVQDWTGKPDDFDISNIQSVINWIDIQTNQKSDFYIIDGYLIDGKGINITPTIRMSVYNEFQEKFTPSTSAIDDPQREGYKKQIVATNFVNTSNPQDNSKGIINADGDVDLVLLNYVQDAFVLLEIKASISGHTEDIIIPIPWEITAKNPTFPITIKSPSIPIIGSLEMDIIGLDQDYQNKLIISYANANELARLVLKELNKPTSDEFTFWLSYKPENINLFGIGRLDRVSKNIEPIFYDQQIFVPISGIHGNNTSYILTYDGSNWTFEDPFSPPFSEANGIGFNNLTYGEWNKSLATRPYDYAKSPLENWESMNKMERRLNWYIKEFNDKLNEETITITDTSPFFKSETLAIPYKVNNIALYPFETAVFKNLQTKNDQQKYSINVRPSNFTSHGFNSILTHIQIAGKWFTNRIVEIQGYSRSMSFDIDITFNGESIFTTDERTIMKNVNICPIYHNLGGWYRTNDLKNGEPWRDYLHSPLVENKELPTPWGQEWNFPKKLPFTIYTKVPEYIPPTPIPNDPTEYGEDPDLVPKALTRAIQNDLLNEKGATKFVITFKGKNESGWDQPFSCDFSGEYNRFKTSVNLPNSSLKTFPTNARFNINWLGAIRNIGWNQKDAWLALKIKELTLTYSGDDLVYEIEEDASSGTGMVYLKSNIISKSLPELKIIESQTTLNFEKTPTTDTYYIAWFYLPWSETEKIEDNIYSSSSIGGKFILKAPDTTDSDKNTAYSSQYTGLIPNLQNWTSLNAYNYDTTDPNNPKATTFLLPFYKIPNLSSGIRFYPATDNFLICCAVFIIPQGQDIRPNLTDYPFFAQWKNIKLNVMSKDSIIDGKDFISNNTGKVINGQLFLYGGNTRNKMFFSYPQKVNYFPQDNFIELKQIEKGDQILGIYPYKNIYIIMAKFKMILMSGSEEQNWKFKELDGAIGSVNANSIIEYSGSIYFLSIEGFRQVKSVYATDSRIDAPLISKKINRNYLLPLLTYVKDINRINDVKAIKYKNVLYWFFPVSPANSSQITNKTGICIKYYPLLSQETKTDVWSVDESEIFYNFENVYLDDIEDSIKIVKVMEDKVSLKQKIQTFVLQKNNNDRDFTDRLIIDGNDEKKDIIFDYNSEIKSKNYNLNAPLNPKQFKEVQWKFNFKPINSNDEQKNEVRQNIDIFAEVFIDNQVVSTYKKKNFVLKKDANGNMVGEFVEEETVEKLNVGSILNNTFITNQAQANSTSFLIKAVKCNNIKGITISYSLKFQNLGAFSLESCSIIHRLKKARSTNGQILNQNKKNV